ncbi:MAG: aminomethyl-transferring glycine dehydrogenase [Rhizobiales bacterium]|nr:aminomethyl-transferring glycine dehydrogenase [Hyphomicrobiales bacterium]
MTKPHTSFVYRHIGPSLSDQRTMLDTLNVNSLDALIDQTVPDNIRFKGPLNIESGSSEQEALAELHEKMSQNIVAKSLIGQGYHNCHVPPVIQRNLLENPGWYTSYTPYQPEISQGRLEMLFHYQTLISELTGLPVANASLLDEGTAVAEACGIAFRQFRSARTKMVVANALHPQTMDVLKTRGSSIGFDVAESGSNKGEIDETTAAVIIQYPDTFGGLIDPKEIVAKAKEAGALVIVCADPMALVLLDAPGNWGADMVVGCIQRFGVPLGNGGPHAAFLATTNKITRTIPGRLIGESIDSKGRKAYRLALQTREQHIRREKATSNICTAQALLANMAASFAIWHGPDGLKAIASEIHKNAVKLASGLNAAGRTVTNTLLFDTVTFEQENANALASKFESAGYIVRVINENTLSIAVDETTTDSDLAEIASILEVELPNDALSMLPKMRNHNRFLTQEIFHSTHCETDMMRLLRKLMDKDLALDKAMIPLGSCTMKLNAAAEMMPISWNEVANIHPFAPEHHRIGYKLMIDDLDRWLSEITGFAKVSFQPNAGSQGEYAGLLAIRDYHKSNGEGDRNICLIPSSAHGTNPASAQMIGYKVVVVKCTEIGDIDLEDLAAKAELHKDKLAALMVTYPSTHGVFEAGVKKACAIIHDHGGQVYLDGANLNAMVGLARPGDIGGDVCHMNLHKTFCIPHGGGGPGVGPIGVAAHLVPFLPGHVEHNEGLNKDRAVSSAPFGSASILPISWMYIRMLGAEGLTLASKVSILSANYIAKKISPHIPLLFSGANGRVAHECILDTRVLKETAGISVDDVAKRLIDYGFHAPTMSWPVAGTLMVEPTESEPLREIDRFIDAMIAIAGEAKKVELGEWSLEDNPLVNAPHTAEDLMADEWSFSYSRKQAGFPAGVDVATKYWAPVSRVDNVHGDRNLVCSCPPMEEYSQEAAE